MKKEIARLLVLMVLAVAVSWALVKFVKVVHASGCCQYSSSCLDVSSSSSCWYGTYYSGYTCCSSGYCASSCETTTSFQEPVVALGIDNPAVKSAQPVKAARAASSAERGTFFPFPLGEGRSSEPSEPKRGEARIALPQHLSAPAPQCCLTPRNNADTIASQLGQGACTPGWAG